MRQLLQITLLLAGLAWCVPAHAITCVQGGPGCTSTTLRNCTASAAACTITVGSTVAGHVEAVCGHESGSSTATMSASVSDGTFTVLASTRGVSGNDVGECQYQLSATGGKTSIVCTFNSGSSTDCEFFEFSITNTPATIDAGTSGTDATCTSCNGVALSLANSNNHILLQSIFDIASSATAISQSYNIDEEPTTGNAFAYKLATVAGTTPAWTTGSTTAVVNGFSIYEAAAASTFRTQIGATLVGF